MISALNHHSGSCLINEIFVTLLRGIDHWRLFILHTNFSVIHNMLVGLEELKVFVKDELKVLLVEDISRYIKLKLFFFLIFYIVNTNTFEFRLTIHPKVDTYLGLGIIIVAVNVGEGFTLEVNINLLLFLLFLGVTEVEWVGDVFHLGVITHESKEVGIRCILSDGDLGRQLIPLRLNLIVSEGPPLCEALGQVSIVVIVLDGVWIQVHSVILVLAVEPNGLVLSFVVLQAMLNRVLIEFVQATSSFVI